MLVDLFNSISLDKFLDIKDFSIFKSLCSDIRSLTREEFNRLTNPYYCSDNPLLWQVHYSWCKGTSQPGNVYMVVTLGGSRATLLMKITQIYNAKFITLIDVPLTDNDNLRNYILEHLKELDFFKFIFKKNYLPYYEDKDYYELPSYNDYYYNLCELNFNGKWLKKNKIKRYFTKDFRVEVVDHITNKEEQLALREVWGSALSKKHKSKVSNNALFSNITNNIGDNMWYNIYYKDKLIASSCVGLDNDYALWFFEISIGRVKRDIEDQYLRASIQNITNVLLYFITKDLLSRGINRLYIAGCSDNHSKQNLLNHKASTTHGCIEYYKVN